MVTYIDVTFFYNYFSENKVDYSLIDTLLAYSVSVEVDYCKANFFFQKAGKVFS